MRPASGRYEKLLDRAMDYYWWGKTFGWTPDEVDRQPHLKLKRIRTVAEIIAEVQEEKDRAANRDR